MHSSPNRPSLLLGGLLTAAALGACGGGGGDSAPAAPVAPVSTMGTLSVGLTDAPACGFDAVNVTVTKVRVNKSASADEADGGWTDITLSNPKKVNLLNLTNGVLETLGQTSLEAGQYNQLRLVLDANANGTANTVVPSDTKVERPLETPSAVQSGIKLVGSFNVEAGQRADVVIDFDACKSVVTRGKGAYALKPVVKMLPSAINGISGFVSPAVLGKNVTVSAQQNGTIVSATTPNATTGEFLLSRLAPGNYDVVITANDSGAAVVGAVPVATTSSNTALSTAAAPLMLAPSTMGSIAGMVTMTPPSTTEAAYVAAKQSFAAGQAVTIRYQGADLASGAYTIANLPVAAPQYATYSATLPLAFAPAANVTGGTYRVEASAAGYTAKGVDAVSIATANALGVNFTLTP
ncbi:DUF4382 domain-containing protein [Massilia niabensis]|uniref:DUF4382 domain-containing protein n=1 Tax=Massilia niabensis TaxID=544910 RepID=A0ABW0KYS9_9BURK